MAGASSERKASALLVGLTSVDSTIYKDKDGRPWDGKNGCWGCERDVERVETILTGQGIRSQKLLTRSATKEAVLENIRVVARDLKSGGLFVFYFSGHGSRREEDEVGGVYEERDGYDETICCYNGQIIDDDLRDLWHQFKPGVRIVMLSDSCHSGTNYGDDMTVPDPEMKAMLIHIGACRDEQTSDGPRSGGVFTTSLVKVWDGGRFDGNYRRLQQRILEYTTSDEQRATYNEFGPTADRRFRVFRSQKPFTVEFSLLAAAPQASAGGAAAGAAAAAGARGGFLHLPPEVPATGTAARTGGETPAELLRGRGTFSGSAGVGADHRGRRGGAQLLQVIPPPVRARVRRRPRDEEKEKVFDSGCCSAICSVM